MNLADDLKSVDEAKKMCEALLELMKDELDAREKAGIIRLIQTKLSKGKTIEAIAEDLEDSVENILALIKEMEKE